MMDKLKFGLFSIVVMASLVLFIYWAISTLQPGSEFVADQKVQQPPQENNDSKNQTADLVNNLNNTTQPQSINPAPATQTSTPAPVLTVSTPAPTQPITYKNQNLIDALQQLITDNISMKLKSSGTRVGTVQDFLNIYNNSSNKVDNSYGASTEKAVATFQKDQGLTADGQAGSGTFSKMIDWLKKQG